MRRQLTPRLRHRAWLVARWVVLGLVTAGVLGMHVLTAPGAGGHHLMAMPDMPAISTGEAPAAVSVDLAAAGTASLTGPVTRGNMAALACCVLFLISSASLILWALRGVAQGGLSFRAHRPAPNPLQVLFGREPPGRHSPRISLCVLRV